jgi:cation diffusion facilitator family transporter
MLAKVLDRFGFGGHDHGHAHDGHGHDHGAGSRHGHTHGVIDPTIATTERGIWAVKWSFVILAVTAALQLVVVAASGSVALLADTIHNIGDAATAVPLWIAFVLARRKPTDRFTYGLGRVEDLAGIAIVAIILSSAVVAGYQAVDRLIHPQAIALLGAVAVAGVIGFVGNEAVAVFRIRVGREIESAALIADGYHARTDGLTSLAVVLGAAGVWLGFPLADPIIGLIITVVILGIVWQSSRAVLTRMLDGVEPGLVGEIRHAVGHVAAVRRVLGVRARWLGHRLTTELDVAVAGSATVREAEAISAEVERELLAHIPALSSAHVRARPEEAVAGSADAPAPHHRGHAGHHHAPAPARVKGRLAEGTLAITDTTGGERLLFTAARLAAGAEAIVIIDRPGRPAETLALTAQPGDPACLISATAPAEPHEFDGRLLVRAAGREEVLPFRMVEPVAHAH